jgi:hypothetical protein
MSKTGIVRITDVAKTEECVRRALEVFKADGSIAGENALKFTRILFALAELVEVPGFEENREDKRGVIWATLSRLRGYKNRGGSDFLRALRLEIRKLPSSGTYIVVFPLNLKQSCLRDRKSIAMPNGVIQLQSLAEAFSKLDMKVAFEDRRAEAPDGRDPLDLDEWTFLSVDVDCRETWQAFDAANLIIEPFRALLNLSEEYGRIHWRAGIPRAIAKVPSPKYVYVFDQHGKYLHFGYTLLPYADRAVDFRPEQLKQVWDAADHSGKIGSDVLRHVLQEALRLYVRALDERESHLAFFSLWQCLELLTRKGEGQSEREVVERTTGVFLKNPTIADSLRILMRKRNRVVHEGRADLIQQDDVNILKTAVEGMISFFMYLAPKLDSEGDMVFFYQQATSDKDTIHRRYRILQDMVEDIEQAAKSNPT